MKIKILRSFRNCSSITIHCFLPYFDNNRIIRIVRLRSWPKLLCNLFPHLSIFSIVSEDIRKHSFGLVSIWQVHDYPTPLFSKSFIFFVTVSTRPFRFLDKVVECLTNSLLVTSIGKLPIEYWLITVDTDLLFTVGKNT